MAKQEKHKLYNKAKLKNGVKITRLNFDFDVDEWHTEDTYNNNFKVIPEAPGVYMIVGIDMSDNRREVIQEIVYIGCSANLKSRLNTHPVLRVAKAYHWFVPVYFKECDNYLEVEKELIKKHNPRINING